METPRQPLEDPFAQLADWGRDVERRVGRGQRWRQRIREHRRWAILPLVLAVLAGLCYGGSKLTGGSATPTAYPSVVAPSGITATSGPASTVDNGPFAGTPADKFPSGAAGLVMPAAKGTGKWSQKEVAAALAQVRKALIASHLDNRMLIQHDPTTFINLLAPANRKVIRKEIEKGEMGTSAVRIAKGSTLSQQTPRVSGRTTYRAIVRGELPALEIITNYVFVYAFDTGPTWSGGRVAVVHSEVRWHFPKHSRLDPDYRGMNMGASKGYWAQMDCAQSSLGFTAPWRELDASANPNPTVSIEPDDAYFQPDHTLDVEGDCS